MGIARMVLKRMETLAPKEKQIVATAMVDGLDKSHEKDNDNRLSGRFFVQQAPYGVENGGSN